MTLKGQKQISWKEAHSQIRRALIEYALNQSSTDAMSKAEIRRKTKLSRPTIDAHLRAFEKSEEVKRIGRKYRSNEQWLLLRKNHLIDEILATLKAYDKWFLAELYKAEDALKGEELDRRRFEIIEGELSFYEHLWADLRKRGLKEAAERENACREQLRALQKASTLDEKWGITKAQIRLRRDREKAELTV